MENNSAIDTFDIVVHRVVDHAEIPQKTTFGCELTIPGSTKVYRESKVYHHRGGRKLILVSLLFAMLTSLLCSGFIQPSFYWLKLQKLY